jgi:hypothetical protein
MDALTANKLKWVIPFLITTVGGGVTYGADQRINPYADKETHYELPLKSDIPQRERVEIAKDRAAMTLKGWNDEYAITIEPQIPTASFGATERPFVTQANRPLLSRKIEYRTGDVTAFIEPRSDNEFDIDFTLHAKPDTNVFTYKIEGADEFDFWYQPALTDEEIAEGASRPDNVVGSYAVYHKSKANHRIGSTNYATGKAFHIYRPKAIDASGAETWAELNYNDGVLSVSVPQTFLDNAVYPVVVDPTFGYSTCGASQSFNYADESGDTSIRLGRGASSTVSGTLSYLNLCTKLTTGESGLDMSMFLNVEDTAADSHTQVASVERLNITLASNVLTWLSFTAASESVAVDDYIISALGDGESITTVSNAARSSYDSGSPNTDYAESATGAGGYAARKETPWTETDSSSTNVYSMYMTVSTTDVGTYTDYYVAPGYFTWTVPTGVTSAIIACWGGGGAGFDGSTSGGGRGGGGGAFASTTQAVSASDVIRIFVGSGGATSASNGATSTASTTAPATIVAAAPGTGGKSATTLGGEGGLTSVSTGTTKNAGGRGGAGNGTDDAGGGGGGAGGPHGAGAVGSDATASAGGAGGTGDNTAGGAGGNGGNGGACTAGTANANGGGGGGGADNNLAGCNGAAPGAGGGGGEGGPGIGAAGQCTITYTVAAGGGGGDSSTINKNNVIWLE